MKLPAVFQEDKTIVVLLGVFLILRLALLIVFPLTGDEAYLINLGLEPRFAYFDHPQFHPWLVYVLSWVSPSYIWMRIAGSLMVLASGYAIYRSAVLLEVGRRTAMLMAMVYLLGTVNALTLSFVNDVSILFVLSWTTYSFLLYLRQPITRNALLTGLIAGAAFLIKYTTVIIVAPFFVVLLWHYRYLFWRFTLYFTLGFTPLLAINLYANYTHCWANIAFNVFNRGGQFQIQNLVESIPIFLLMLNPILPYYLYKGARTIAKGQVKLALPPHVLLMLILLPLLLFIVVALKKAIYGAWVLDFAFILFLLLLGVSTAGLRRAAVISFAYSMLLLTLIGVMLWKQDTINTVPRYQIVFTPQEFCKAWKSLAPGYIRAGNFYDETSVLSYHCGKTVTMFMDNYFGRDDDFAVDYKQLDGKDIAIVLLDDDYGRRYRPEKMGEYFASYEIKPFTVGKFNYGLLLGKGFKYAKYYSEFIVPMYQKNYARPLPKWFPRSAACPMIRE